MTRAWVDFASVPLSQPEDALAALNEGKPDRLIGAPENPSRSPELGAGPLSGSRGLVSGRSEPHLRARQSRDLGVKQCWLQFRPRPRFRVPKQSSV